jgi:hypothetical protein
MRAWRFNNAGEAKDAGLFDDTFFLTIPENASVGISQEKSPDEARKDWEQLRDLINSRSFAYACIWKGFVFPVTDFETRSLDSLREALKIRQFYGNCWFWWKRR